MPNFIAPTSLCNRNWVLRLLYGRRATTSLLLEKVNKYTLLYKPKLRSSILVHGQSATSVAMFNSSNKLNARAGITFRGCFSAYLRSMSAKVVWLIGIGREAMALMLSSEAVVLRKGDVNGEDIMLSAHEGGFRLLYCGDGVCISYREVDSWVDGKELAAVLTSE